MITDTAQTQADRAKALGLDGNLVHKLTSIYKLEISTQEAVEAALKKMDSNRQHSAADLKTASTFKKSGFSPIC